MAEQATPFPFRIPDNQSPVDAQAILTEARYIVGNDMSIEFVETPKDPKLGAVAIRGRLLKPSESIFPSWLAEFSRRGYTPALQRDPEGASEDSVILRIASGAVRPSESPITTNVILFVITLLSTFFVGASYGGADVSSLGELFLPQNLIKGWPFALTVMGILTAHEFGHYFAARYHKVAVTLPYFIPLPPPIGLFGTLGAFIRLKEPIPDRRKLFDIGVAGPLAGIVVAIPLLFIGLSTSDAQIPTSTEGILLEGNSILYHYAKILVFGEALPNPVTGRDVFMNQVTFAAWIGILVTALNLLPVGQLDGGHTVFALMGNSARKVNVSVLILMAILGFLGLPLVQSQIPGLEDIGFVGWFVWLGIIMFVIGPFHPPALDDVTQLDQRRRWIGYLVIIIFILTFTPVPLRPL